MIHFSDLNILLTQRFTLPGEIPQLIKLLEDGNEDDEGENTETKWAFAGADTETFVNELSGGHYTQNELQTYWQIETQSVVSEVSKQWNNSSKK